MSPNAVECKVGYSRRKVIKCYLPISISPDGRTHPRKIQSVSAKVIQYYIRPLNLEGGQCSWCGKYGHKRCACPLLKC